MTTRRPYDGVNLTPFEALSRIGRVCQRLGVSIARDNNDAFNGKGRLASGKVESLIDEQLEIQQIFDKCQPSADIDTQWALYLLDHSLKYRREELIQLIEKNSAGIGQT